MHSKLKALARFFSYGQKLHDVTQLFGIGNIRLGDIFNPLDGDRFEINFRAKRQAREDREFMRRIDPLDIESRIFFRKSLIRCAASSWAGMTGAWVAAGA